MEDLPKTVADFLESTAMKVRSLTVDRLAAWTVWAAVGIFVAMAALLLGIFLLIGLFRLIETAVGSATIAYAILAVLFLIAGMVLWSKRVPKALKQP